MHIDVPAERIPIAHETDVLVVGGGPAGVAAAFAAARMGADTLIVEQFNCLGGVATAGGHGHICIYSAWETEQRIVGGIPLEMGRRVAEAGYGTLNARGCHFEIEGMKRILEQMATESGTRLLYHTFFSDVLMDGDRVAAAIVQNKNGRQAIRARQFIDCTGDGDVAARAGCAFELGSEETGLCQPMTLMFTIGGVDHDRVWKFHFEEYPRAHPEEERPYKLASVWKEAQERGDMRPFQSVIMGWWYTPTRPDQLGINFTHVNYVDACKAEDLTAATLEARKQVFETIEVYRKYIPGMQDIYLVSTPATIGIRESRRIRTAARLTRDDLLSRREWKDSIGYGSFFIDIHNTRGPGMDRKRYVPEKGFRYQIPYGICRPEGVANLQVAGRCAGADHEALGSLRVMAQCGVMGQAAGTAAAMAAARETNLDALATGELQTQLRAQGCIVTQADIPDPD